MSGSQKVRLVGVYRYNVAFLSESYRNFILSVGVHGLICTSYKKKVFYVGGRQLKLRKAKY